MEIQDLILFAAEAVQTAAEGTGDAAQAADSGVLGTLGINWKLFLAQLINFAVVLFIFWRWIAKPLTKALIARQERIESGLKNADLIEREKKSFEDWKGLEMKKVRNEAENILKSTTETATKLKQDILNEAHAQSAKVIEQAKSQVELEKTRMIKEVKEEIATLVVIASEKILKAKLDPKKDQNLIEESIKAVNK
jgi:F-type H+-transporting ATPase subunit b